jgi:hypothetical protein
MKSKIKFVVATLIIAFITGKAYSQGNQKEFSEWPELKNFHTVMAQTFHPSEEGNFKPIRQRSGELYTKAVKLSESKVPADLNKPEVNKAVKELVNSTKQVDELVKKNATDDQLKTALVSAHESFHKIVGLCSKEDEHREEHKE